MLFDTETWDGEDLQRDVALLELNIALDCEKDNSRRYVTFCKYPCD